MATTKELAHVDRATPPVINEDISKCQECHLAECKERGAKFDHAADISEALVAVYYQPRLVHVIEQFRDTFATDSAKYSNWTRHWR